MTPRLEMRDVSKAFPGVKALERVSLDVEAGRDPRAARRKRRREIDARQDHRRRLRARRRRVSSRRPPLGDIDEAEAGRLGIGIVHQEGSLVRTLSIADNIFAGRQPTRSFGRIDVAEMVARSRALLDQLGVDIDPRAKVSTLSSAQAQVVEIAKALSQDLRLLDSRRADGRADAHRNRTAVRRPAPAQGERRVDRLCVASAGGDLHDLRSGLGAEGRPPLGHARRRARLDRRADPPDGRARRRLVAPVGRATRRPTVLEVDKLCAEPFVRDASLTVRAGEIVCLAGLVGSGRSEACEAIFGARARSGGEIRMRGAPVRFGSPRDAIAAGVGMAPEDRKDAGSLPDDGCRQQHLGRGDGSRVSTAAWSRAPEARRWRSVSSTICISPRPRSAPVGEPLRRQSAEGDARQMARARSGAPDRRRADARRRRRRPRRNLSDSALARGQGVALLVVSSDLPEVLALADRIVVMADGRTVGELDRPTADEEAVLRLATKHTHAAERQRRGVAA